MERRWGATRAPACSGRSCWRRLQMLRLMINSLLPPPPFAATTSFLQKFPAASAISAEIFKLTPLICCKFMDDAGWSRTFDDLNPPQKNPASENLIVVRSLWFEIFFFLFLSFRSTKKVLSPCKKTGADSMNTCNLVKIFRYICKFLNFFSPAESFTCRFYSTLDSGCSVMKRSFNNFLKMVMCLFLALDGPGSRLTFDSQLQLLRPLGYCANPLVNFVIFSKTLFLVPTDLQVFIGPVPIVSEVKRGHSKNSFLLLLNKFKCFSLSTKILPPSLFSSWLDRSMFLNCFYKKRNSIFIRIIYLCLACWASTLLLKRSLFSWCHWKSFLMENKNKSISWMFIILF